MTWCFNEVLNPPNKLKVLAPLAENIIYGAHPFYFIVAIQLCLHVLYLGKNVVSIRNWQQYAYLLNKQVTDMVWTLITHLTPINTAHAQPWAVNISEIPITSICFILCECSLCTHKGILDMANLQWEQFVLRWLSSTYPLPLTWCSAFPTPEPSAASDILRTPRNQA